MEVDHLHRDANLSLWALAKHTGASSNYISQTLNEVMGESFFDFVNSYRIAEAKTLLATTNESVLNITYDVGFNARSSFYNAFKRHTGQTPTSYRKNLSKPAGMDDITAQPNDI
jgi:AraC-like DNA-binding protein